MLFYTSYESNLNKSCIYLIIGISVGYEDGRQMNWLKIIFSGGIWYL
jgi:hypothetical protein